MCLLRPLWRIPCCPCGGAISGRDVMAATEVRRMLVDSSTSLGAKARLRRWETFRAAFPTIENLRLLDLGGTVETWHRAPVRPGHVTVLNLFEPGESDDDWIVPVTGDACEAADALAK